MKWCSRKDLHPQPPRSKRGALYVELREHWNGAHGRTRTRTGPLLRRLSLHWTTWALKWRPWMELRLLPLCIFRSAPHDCALSRTALHHQLRASKARALLIELQRYRDWSVRLNAMRDSARPKAKPNCVGCEAANLHQHLPGYEPVALPLSYRPMKWSDTPVLPRAPIASKASECCWLSRIR